MLTKETRESLSQWPALSNRVYVPHSEREYESLVALLDDLVDEVGEDEAHPLATLMEVLGVIIEKWEDEHVPEPELKR